MDKLLPPKLNRPGQTQQRPPDPNRFRTIDVTPEDGQHDPQFQSMVADIEALQQRQGWLAGRGAFDKEDLLYLRDREQEQRRHELHKRDAEAAAFAAARARAEQQLEQQAVAKLRHQELTLQEAGRPHGSRPQGAKVAGLVVVKPHKASAQQGPLLQPQQPQHVTPADEDGVQQPIKKQRTEAGPAGSNKQLADAMHHAGPQDLHSPQPTSQPSADINSDRPELLETLLGDYGSEAASDDADHQQHGVTHLTHQRPNGVGQGHSSGKCKLPSAAELLEAELTSSVQLAPVSDPVAAAELHAGVRGYTPSDTTAWV